MFPEVWQRIGVGKFRSQPATLNGFTVFRLCDSVLPGLVKTNDSDQAKGLVYLDVDEEALFELDAYESDLYERITVEATTAEGQAIECQAYVIPKSHHKALTNELWDAAWFEQHELTNYLCG